ncbi:unnamed protein product [Scytosiphon promiscuus]
MAILRGQERASQPQHEQQGPLLSKRNADTLESNNTIALPADEALYRHYPPVNRTSSGEGNILDTANAYTFEALNRVLASSWSPSSAPSPCCRPQEAAAITNNKAMKCLTDSSSNSSAVNTAFKTRDSQPGTVAPLSSSGPPQATEGVVPLFPPHTGDVADVADCRPGGKSFSSSSSQLLFLVRHGETDMNKAGRLQGRGVNAPLNGAGLEQAQGLGRFVRNVPFDTVTSSSLHRAHETAMRIAENNEMCVKRAQENAPVRTAPKKEMRNSSSEEEEEEEEEPTSADFCCGDKAQVRVRQMEGLDELSWGNLEGKDSKAEPSKGRLAALKGAWDDGAFDRAAEGGESLLEVEARARAAVETILSKGEELNLVVSHGRTLRILMLSLTGLGMDQMTNWGKIPNCGMYIIEVGRSGPGGARSYRLLPSCPPCP